MLNTENPNNYAYVTKHLGIHILGGVRTNKLESMRVTLSLQKLRSVYGKDDMRTSYFGLGLKFSDDPKSYNQKNEGVKDFTETLSVEAGGNTFLGFSYEKSEGGESSTEYIISVKTEDGTFAYRKFTDQKEYNAAVKRINEYQKKQKEKEDED